jgi:hypothetical protein
MLRETYFFASNAICLITGSSISSGSILPEKFIVLSKDCTALHDAALDILG